MDLSTIFEEYYFIATTQLSYWYLIDIIWLKYFLFCVCEREISAV